MLKFLGKGSAFSEGVNSCAYFIKNKHLVLFDCGENTFASIKKLVDNTQFFDVSILITHTHADHVSGLSTLIYYLHFVKGIKANVYVGNKCHQDVRMLLDIHGHEMGQYVLYPNEEKKPFQLKRTGTELMFVETEHVPNMPSYGIRFKRIYEDKDFYYSGDSVTVPVFINELIDQLELVWQDVSLNKSGVHMYYKDLPQHYPLRLLKSKKFNVYHCENADIVNSYIQKL